MRFAVTDSMDLGRFSSITTKPTTTAADAFCDGCLVVCHHGDFLGGSGWLVWEGGWRPGKLVGVGRLGRSSANQRKSVVGKSGGFDE
jgi:hypothetical protein